MSTQISIIITVDEHKVSPVVNIGQWYDDSSFRQNKPLPVTSLQGHRNTHAVYKRVLEFAEEIDDS